MNEKQKKKNQTKMQIDLFIIYQKNEWQIFSLFFFFLDI